MTGGVPKPIYIDLATARIADLQIISGRYLKVIEASSDAAVATIGFDTQVGSNNTFTLRTGATFKASFDRFYLNNAAQAGAWMRIVVADGEPGDFEIEYANDVSLSGNLTGITNTVVVRGEPAANTANSQFSVGTGTGSTIALVSRSNRKCLMVSNHSTSAPIFWSTTAGVTTTTGAIIPSGSTLTLDNGSQPSGAIYLVAASTITASITETW